MDGKSLNLTEERLKSLKALLPEVFSEGKIDFQRLKQAFGEDLATPDHYELSWAGKAEARREIQRQTTATLTPDFNESVDFDTSKNVYIEGENLEVMRVLQRSYFGKVKMIYIDPPYNTGNDYFVYPDDYAERKAEYEQRTGQTDNDGFLNKLDLFKTNNGQLHSPWLSMMYPRLFMARNLLREDGVIFVSIDDNEAHNLKLLMDEVFGEENFVASICWQKKYAVSNDDEGMGVMHDYILMYQKSESFQRNLLPRTDKQLDRYKNLDNDPRGVWSSDNYVSNKSRRERPTLYYPIIHPKTGKEVYPDENAVWRYSKEKHQQMVEENRLYWGPSFSYKIPRIKRFLSEVQDGLVPNTWWSFQEVGHNDEGQKETFGLIGKKIFSTPKPSRLINKILKLSTNSNQNHIILDFFGGSATTAQAVLELNVEDGGDRRFVLVQLPELTDSKSEAFHAGYDNVAAIGRERIRRVIKKMHQAATEAKEEVAALESKISERQGKLDELQAIKPKLFEDPEPNKETQKPSGQISKLQESLEEAKEKAQRLHKAPKDFRAFRLVKSNFEVWQSEATTKNEIKKLILDFKAPKRADAQSQAMLFEFLLKKGYPLTAHVEIMNIEGFTAYSVEKGEMWVLLDGYNLAIRERILADKPNHVICLDSLFEGNDVSLTNLHLDLRDRGIDLSVI